MKNTKKHLVFLLGAVAAFLLGTPASAGQLNSITPKVLSVDIPSLQLEFKRPEEIARARPVAISPDVWVKQADGSSTWDYAVTVPGTKSLGLRFTHATLPAGTLLTVSPDTGNGHTYTPDDISAGLTFTTVFVPGDVLRLHVSTPQPDAVVLNADRIYIGAANPVRSTPSSDQQSDARAKAMYASMAAAAVLPSACNDGLNFDPCRRALLQNYACNASASNINQSRASVGLLISNSTGATACTGTLVNNLNSDGKAYIVTAGHCAIEDEGTSNQTVNFNQSVGVYWSGIEGSCGTPYYDASVPAGTNPDVYDTDFYNLSVPVSNDYKTLTHLDTVLNPHAASGDCLETGYNETRSTPCDVGADMWVLSSAKAPPVGANPYWAGVNAADPTVGDTLVPYAPTLYSGGNHLGEQTVTAFGAQVSDVSFPFAFPQTWALSTTGAYNGEDAGPASTPGAAGPATWLVDFDQGTSNGSTGQVSTGSSGSALYDATGLMRGIASYSHLLDLDTAYFRIDLAWKGNATDSTSQLKTYLDPKATGATTVPGFEDKTRTDNLSVVFGALEDLNVAADTAIDLRYFVQESTSCTKSSVPTIAGWSGALSYTNGAAGTATVTVPGASTLTLTCKNAAGYQKVVSVEIDGGATTGSSSSSSSSGSSSSSSSSSSSGSSSSSSSSLSIPGHRDH